VSELLDEAMRYAQRGHPVMPLHDTDGGRCSCSRGDRCEGPAKHPRTAHGVDDATAQPAQVREWWERWPTANIAIATGASGVVLDVDPRNGGDETLAMLERGGKVPPCPTVATGGGGKHFWLKAPAGTPGATLGPGVDLKGAGGYVVAPPSIHASGRHYVWLDRGRTLPPAPAWALPANSGRRRGAPPSEWAAIARRGADAGERNRTAARLAGHLLARDVHPFVTLELLRCWNTRNRPPLGDDELERTITSITRREAHRRRTGRVAA